MRTDLPAWCRTGPGDTLEKFHADRDVVLLYPQEPLRRQAIEGPMPMFVRLPKPIILREHFITRGGSPVARLYLPDGQEPSEADMVEMERVVARDRE